MALAKGTRARQATMSLADPYQTERTRRHRLAPSARSPVLRHPPALRLVGKRAAGGGEGVGHVAWIAGGRDDGGDGGMARIHSRKNWAQPDVRAESILAGAS